MKQIKKVFSFVQSGWRLLEKQRDGSILLVTVSDDECGFPEKHIIRISEDGVVEVIPLYEQY